MADTPAPERKARGLDDSDRLRLQRQQDQQRFAKMEAEINALKKNEVELKRYARKSEREADLSRLQLEEGYEFDLAEELEDVIDLDDGAYAKHRERILKRYSKMPIGQPLPVYRGNATPVGLDKDSMLKITKYASDNGCTFDEAKAKLAGGN